MKDFKAASKMESYMYGSINGGDEQPSGMYDFRETLLVGEAPFDFSVRLLTRLYDFGLSSSPPPSPPEEPSADTKMPTGWLRSTKMVIGGGLLLLLFVASRSQRQYEQPSVALVRTSSSTGAVAGNDQEEQVMFEDKHGGDNVASTNLTVCSPP